MTENVHSRNPRREKVLKFARIAGKIGKVLPKPSTPCGRLNSIDRPVRPPIATGSWLLAAKRREEHGNLLIQEKQDIVRDLVALGQERGFVTLDQVLEHVSGELDSEEISVLLQEVEAAGVDVEGATETADIAAPRRPQLRVSPEPEVHAPGEDSDQGQDLVRTYLRQMSRVPLLTREGEVAIAKRIERGEKRVWAALSRSLIIARHIVDLSESSFSRAIDSFKSWSSFPTPISLTASGQIVCAASSKMLVLCRTPLKELARRKSRAARGPEALSSDLRAVEVACVARTNRAVPNDSRDQLPTCSQANVCRDT